MTLNERVSTLEAKHITNKRSIANANLIMTTLAFVTLLLAVGLITSTEHQQRQISELKTELERVTNEQKDVNQRQDVMINKFNQMYYEYQHKKITGRDDFPGG